MAYVLIVGAGNMGKRYEKMIKSLGYPVILSDVGDQNFESKVIDSSYVLVATPTDTHLEVIDSIVKLRREIPILCEKPINKIGKSQRILEYQEHDVNLQMVDQYAFLPKYDGPGAGFTIYESEKSGDDGLEWDCINIIGKANERKKIKLKVQEGLEWTCRLNGYKVDLKDMPEAYMRMVYEWLRDPKPNYEYMLEAHRRVRSYICDH